MHTYIHRYIHTLHTYIHTITHIHTYIQLHTYIHTITYIHTYNYNYNYDYNYNYNYIHTYIYIYIYTLDMQWMYHLAIQTAKFDGCVLGIVGILCGSNHLLFGCYFENVMAMIFRMVFGKIFLGSPFVGLFGFKANTMV